MTFWIHMGPEGSKKGDLAACGKKIGTQHRWKRIKLKLRFPVCLECTTRLKDDHTKLLEEYKALVEHPLLNHPYIKLTGYDPSTYGPPWHNGGSDPESWE